MSRSRVVRRGQEGWEGVEARSYKDSAKHHLGVARHELLGSPEDALGFEARYFEVAPGGYTSLERHAHGHAVVVLRGRGTVRLGAETESVGPMDVVYVAPWEPHRFTADDDEPLGFLCVVDRERDRPQLLDEPATPG